MVEKSTNMPEVTNEFLINCIECYAFHYKYSAAQNFKTPEFKEKTRKIKSFKAHLNQFIKSWEDFSHLEKNSLLPFLGESLLKRMVGLESVAQSLNDYGSIDPTKAGLEFFDTLRNIEKSLSSELDRFEYLEQIEDDMRELNEGVKIKNYKDRGERLLEDPSRKFAHKKLVQHLLTVYADFTNTKPTYTIKVSKSVDAKSEKPDISLWVQWVFEQLVSLDESFLDDEGKDVQKMLDINGVDTCVKRGCSAFPNFW